MKQPLLFFRIVLLTGLMSLLSGIVSAQQFYTVQKLVANNSKVQVKFCVRNNTGSGFALGYSDIFFNTFQENVGSPTSPKVDNLDGRWDDGVSPRFYNDVIVSYVPSLNSYQINIRRTSPSIDTTAPPAASVLADGDTAVICGIELPIINCQGTSNITFDQSPDNTLISNFANTDISSSVSYSQSTINLAPSAPAGTLVISGAPGNLFCGESGLVRATLTVTGAREYRFLKRGRFSDTSVISEWSASNTLAISANSLSDGDTIIGYIRDAFCIYRYASADVVRIESRITQSPQFITTTGTNRISLNNDFGTPRRVAPNTDFSIVPVDGASTYVWTIEPANNTGSNNVFVGPSNTTNVTVNWDDNYVGVIRIYVAAVNTCGVSAQRSEFYVRINSSAPDTSNIPRFVTRPTSTPVCITDPSLSSFSISPTLIAESYDWHVFPSDAAESVTTVINGDTATDGLQANITWNRNFRGNSVRVIVRASNSFGPGDSAYSQLVIPILRLPFKPLAIRSDRVGDKKCQPLIPTDIDSVTFTVTPNLAGGAISATKGYRWYFERTSIGGLSSGFNPIDASDKSNVRGNDTAFITTLPRITVKINPKYFGYFRVYAATNSSNCHFGTHPFSNLHPSFGGDTSGVGEVLTDTFFVKPVTPTNTGSSVPTPIKAGKYSLLVNDTRAGGDTIKIKYPSNSIQYGDSVIWEFTRAKISTNCRREDRSPTDTNKVTRCDTVFSPNSPDASLAFFPLSNARSSDTVMLRLRPNAVVGDYFLRAHIVNQDCGGRFYSRSIRIRVTDGLPLPVDSIGYFRFRTVGGKVTIKKDTIFIPEPTRLCSAGDNVDLTFKVLRKRDSSFIRTTGRDSAYFANNYSRLARTYNWTVRPARAATITAVPLSDTVVGGVFYQAPSDTSLVRISINPANAQTVYPRRIVVYAAPINAANFGTRADSAAQVALSDSIVINVYKSPTVFAGNPSSIPAGIKYVLGGGAIAFNDRITVESFNGRIDTNKIKWSKNFGGIDIPFFTPQIVSQGNLNTNGSRNNPVISALQSGNQNIGLYFEDSVRCYAKSTVTIGIFNSYNYNLKAYLEGPLNPAGTLMSDNLNAALDVSNVSLLKRFELASQSTYGGAPSEYMLQGFDAPITRPAGSRIVDVVSVAMYRDSNFVSSVGTPSKAFLTQDGSVIDFETGTKNYALFRLVNAPSQLGSDTTNGLYVKVTHRNHFPLAGKRKTVKPKYNSPVDLTATDGRGYIDLTNAANVYGAGESRVDGINYRLVNGQVVMIAGDAITEDDKGEVNSYDVITVGNAALNNAGQGGAASYNLNDLDLNGIVNSLDKDIAIRNNVNINFTTIRR